MIKAYARGILIVGILAILVGIAACTSATSQNGDTFQGGYGKIYKWVDPDDAKTVCYVLYNASEGKGSISCK